MKILICCCCGGVAPGRQWWNRDTGYGICPRCFKLWVEKLGAEEAIRCCGQPGVHHSLDVAGQVEAWEQSVKDNPPQRVI